MAKTFKHQPIYFRLRCLFVYKKEAIACELDELTLQQPLSKSISQAESVNKEVTRQYGST